LLVELDLLVNQVPQVRPENVDLLAQPEQQVSPDLRAQPVHKDQLV